MLQILNPVIDYLDLFLDHRHPLSEAVVLPHLAGQLV